MQIPHYTPATREQLAEMNEQQLLAQYQSLVDLLKETRGILFERNPSCGRDELARLIWQGQSDCLIHSMAEQLREWEEHLGITYMPAITARGEY